STSSSTSTSSTTTTTLAGPGVPGVNFANVTATQSGAGSPGDSGGRNVAFTAFAPPTWSKLYWGSSSSPLPRASLNGVFVTLPFVSASGTTATWQSNAVTWTNPQTSVTTSTNKIKLTIMITSGAVSWANSTSFAGLDPGPGTGIGGAINVAPSGTAINFTV